MVLTRIREIFRQPSSDDLIEKTVFTETIPVDSETEDCFGCRVIAGATCIACGVWGEVTGRKNYAIDTKPVAKNDPPNYEPRKSRLLRPRQVLMLNRVVSVSVIGMGVLVLMDRHKALFDFLRSPTTSS